MKSTMLNSGLLRFFTLLGILLTLITVTLSDDTVYASVDFPQLAEATVEPVASTPVPTNTPTNVPADQPETTATQSTNPVQNRSQASSANSVTVAPIPNFEVDPREGNAPLTVTLTNTTTGNVTNWLWDFGDGTTSTEQHPGTHTFGSPGTYTLRLSASNEAGSSEAFRQVVVFEDREPTEANFNFALIGEFDGTQQVCFTDLSQGTINTYSWAFGDNTSSNESNPCHTYISEGNYTVTLYVDGANNETSSASRVVSIVAQTEAPTAQFSANRTTVTVNDRVDFTDQSTGLITAWLWDFGDGVTSTDRNPGHQYTGEGSFSVTLTVTGPGGSSQTSDATITVNQPALTCNYTVQANTFVNANVNFDGRVSNANERVITFNWTLDGRTIATTEDFSYVFPAEGSYVVVFNVEASDGETCRRERTINVNAEQSAFADFGRSPARGAEGTQVCFTDQSTGTVASWLWDFRDGSVSSEQNPCHIFNDIGRYNVGLTVTAANGTTSSRSRSVDIFETQSLSINAMPQQGIAPLTVNLSAVSTGLYQNSFEWILPDSIRATGDTLHFTFRDPGDHTVILNGSGPLGDMSASIIIHVDELPDIRAAFTPSRWNGVVPTEICFTDESEGGVIDRWSWDFGNGQTSTLQNPCTMYSQPGEYTITLNVTNQFGLSASASNYIQTFILVDSDDTFTFTIVNGLTVEFIASDGANVQSWNFGDGQAGGAQSSIVHTYATGGLFDVIMSVLSDTGQTTVVRRTLFLEEGVVEARTTSTPTVGIADQTPQISVFDPALSKVGELPAGSIGLPGEQLNWIVTVTNNGTVAGRDVVIVDNVRPEMRVDGVSLDSGTFTIDGQLVTVTIPVLNAGESIDFSIETTVLSSPRNGIMTNTVTTQDNSESAEAQVILPIFSQTATSGFSRFASIVPPPAGPNPNIAGLPDVDVFAGEQVCFDASFTNTGFPGYGPYLRIILPPELILDSLNFINTPQTPIFVGTFPAAPGNQLIDPISVDTITGIEGYRFWVVRYPIGSVVQGNPPLDMNVCVTVDSNSALIGVDYPIEIIPGYEFGDTATGSNGPIVDPADPGKDGEITPILVLFDKSDNTPEGERPPGPDWTYQYTLTITLAPGQRLVNASFNDALDADWQFVSLDSVSGTCTRTPLNGTQTLPAAPPPEVGGGALAINFTEINNGSTATPCDVTIVYSGYILDILTETGIDGDPAEEDIFNTASFDTSWTGNADDMVIPQAQQTDTNTVLVENQVFQKGVSPADVIPGTALSYTINFQITQYDAISSSILTDVIPSGISTDYDSYQVVIGGTTYPIDNANITRTCNADGTITVQFNLLDAVGIPTPIPGSTAGQVQYEGEVDSFYRLNDSSCNLDTNEPVRASDILTNTVNGNFVLQSGATQQNNSSATVVVLPITITKETLTILNPPENGVGYVHGEDVTFRLAMEIPSGDTQGVVFKDFFPLPVFDIDDADLGFELPGGVGPFTLPIQNTTNLCFQQFTDGDNTHNCGITWGPNTTIMPDIQSFTINGAENSLTIIFDDVNTSGVQTIEIDITISVIDNPFADGLFLSNQFEAQVENSDNVVLTADAISYLRLNAPFLEIVKSVASTSDTSAMIFPETDPTEGNDASDLDAGDLVTYTITVGNIGGAQAFDVLITDDVPVGLENCTLLTVTNGGGTPLAFTGDLFTGGITLNNSIPGNASFSTAGTTETVIATVRCELIDGVAPIQSIVNTATVDWSPLPETYTGYPYNSVPVDYPVQTEDATIQVRDVAITKDVLPLNPTIGEIVTYTIQVDVPEGTINNAQVQDILPAGMAFVDCISVTSNGTLNTSLSGNTDFSAACNDPVNPTVAGGGLTITFDLGNLTPASSVNNGQNDEIVIIYTAVVLDVAPANVRGTTLTNTATFSSNDTTDKTDTATITLIEPELQIDKTANPITGDAGDTITFTLTISHVIPQSNATAYDVVLTDVVPSDLINVTITGGSGVAPTTGPTVTGNTIDASWDSLTTAQNTTITFTAQLVNGVEPGQVITNQADITYDSLAGDDVANQSPYTTPTDRERDYTDDDDATVTVPRPTIVKTVVDTSDETTAPDSSVGVGGFDGNDPDLTIGEEVTFQLVATFIEGVTQNVVITDDFPTIGVAFGYVSSRIVSIGTTTTNGVFTDGNVVVLSAAVGDTGTAGANNVSWNLGTVAVAPNSANATVVFEVVLRVDNNVANNGTGNNDKNVNNTGTLAYTDALSVPSTAVDTESVDIVEPELQLIKDNNPTGATVVDAGDFIEFRLTIDHTANSRANAYEIVVTDTLPPESIYQNVVSSTCGVVTDVYAAPTVTFSFAQLTLATDSCDIVYRVQVAGSVQPSQTYTNSANATYSTQPGTPTDDRTSVTNTDTADYQTQIPVVGKTIVSTSEIDTTGNTVAIGEIIRYQIVVTVPEGITNGVIVTDHLAPGLAFMEIDGGANPASIIIPGSVTSSNGTATVIRDAGIVGTTCSDLSTQNGCEVTFDFGNLTNTDTDNATDEEIIIEYSVVVLDVVPNMRGQTRTNTVNVAYASGTAVSQSAPDVTIVEPQLQIDKTANPITGDAGDTITFTLTISHVPPPSNAPAYDVVVNDVVPAEFTNVIVTSTGGVAPTTGASVVGNTINASYDRLLVGQTATITFTAQLINSVEPAQVITNNADITYDSLPGDNVSNQSPYNVTSDERDYTHDDDALVTVISPTITKVVFGTSDAGNQDYAIGEEITYHITVTLPEGVTENVIVSDTPSVGGAVLTPISMIVLGVVDGTDNAYISSNAVVIGTSDATAPLSIDFGDVTNPPGSTNQIVLEVVVRVADVAANIGTVPAQDTNVPNTATLEYVDANNAPQTLTDDAVVNVIEPELTVSKDNNPTGIPTVQAGDTIQFRITVTHTANSLATAHDIILADTLPTVNTSFGSIIGASTTCIGANGNFVSPVITFTVPTLTLAAGSCDIVYSVVIGTDVEPSSTYTNTVAGTYSTQPGTPPDDRTSPIGTDTAQFRTPAPTIVKSTFSTSHSDTGVGSDADQDLTIGEVVTYHLTVTFPEGTTENVRISDDLPSVGVSFEYISSQIVSIGTGMTLGTGAVGTAGTFAGNTVTWTPGTVTNPPAGGNTVVFEVVARVDDLVANVGLVTGQDLNVVNTARVIYEDRNNVDQTRTDTVTVDIVEPQLALTKTRVTVAPTFEAGDSVQYTITVNHTAQSTANAYDILVTDLLPTNLTAFASLDGGTCTVSNTNTVTAGQVIFTVAQLNQPGNCTITYTVTLGNDIEPNTTYTNSATATYTSLPGAPADDRTSTTNTATATFITPGPTITKAVFGTSDAGNQNYAIGEEITYHITLTLTEGTTENVVVSDTAPTGMAVLTPVSMTVLPVIDGTDNAFVSSTGVTIGSSDTTAPLSIDFGDIINPPGSTNQIVLEVIARVTDTVANSGIVPTQDTNVTNTATLDYLDGNDVAQVDTDTALVNFIEPELTVAKANEPIGIPIVDGGDTIQFRITVSHTANSLSTAHDIILSDTLPTAGTSFVSVDAGTTCAGVASSFVSPTITFTVPTLTLAASTCDIVYSVQVGIDVAASSTYTNTVIGTYSTQPGTPPDDRTKPIGTDTAQFQTRGPQFNKTIITTSLIDTGNGINTDPDLTIGETVTYELVATLPEGANNNLQIVDTLPNTFTVVSSTVVSIGGNSTAGMTNGGNLSGGILAVGASGTVGANTVTFNFGNISNAADGTTTEADRIRVQLVVRLADDAANSSAQIKTNTGAINYTDSANNPVSQTDTADIDVVEPLLNLIKDFSQTDVVRGTTLSMTLTLTNNGTAPAYDILVTDIFNNTNPSGDVDLSKVRVNSIVVTSQPVGANTNTSGSVTGSYGNSTVNATIDRLLIGESVVLTVSITIDPTAVPVPLIGVNALDNTATANYDSLPGDNSVDRDYTTTGNDTLNIVVPTLTVTKVDNVDPVNAGNTVTYNITITNTGTPNIPANEVIMRDTLPTPTQGATVELVVPSQGSCSPLAAGVLTCNLGTIASGASATIQVTMRVNAANIPQTMTNNVNVTTQEGNDQNTAETTDITRSIDLALTKTVSQPLPDEGDTITYTLRAVNNGPSNATNVVIMDTLPAGVTFSRFVPNTLPCNFTAPTLTCTFPALAATRTINVGVEVIVDANAATQPQPIVNNASVIANESGGAGYPNETNSTNNTATAPITVQTVDIAVTKTVNPAAPNEGDTITYTITVINNGPADATNVQILDDFNAVNGISYVSDNSASTGTSYVSATGVWTIGTLISGNSRTLIVTATVDVGASGLAQPIVNTATVSNLDQTDRDLTNNDDDASITVDGLDLLVEKTVNNLTPQEGNTIVYAIRVTNLGVANATNVQVTDNLNGVIGISYIADNSASTGTTYTSATGVWNVGNLIAGDSRTLLITALVDSGAAAQPQPIVNNANLTQVDQTDADPTNNTDDASITIRSIDLQVTKTVSNNTPQAGDQIVYMITVRNNGPANGTGIVINDDLDANLTFVSATPNGVYNSVTGLWTVGNLNAGSSAVLTITATVNATAISGQVIPNVASVDSVDQTDSNPTNNSDDASVTVDGLDLVVTKTVDDTTPREGDTITYIIVVENLGSANATGVVIEDIFPAGLSNFTYNTVNGSYNAGSNLWTVGALLAGDSATLVVTATVDAGTSGSTITNTASLNNVDQPDTDPTNNIDTAIVTVESVDLSVVKSVDNVGPSQGDTIIYTIVVTNNGAGNATGVTVTENIPADGVTFTLIGIIASQGSYTSTPPNSTWLVGNLASGASATLMLTVRVETNAGIIPNTVSVTGDQPDPNLANNTDTQNIAIDGTDLAVEKSVDNPTPFSGDTITYTIIARNLGPNDTTGVVVSDILPAGVNYVSDDSASTTTTYDNATGNWTIGAMTSGSTVTLNITVTVTDTSGVVVNSADIAGDALDPEPSNNTDNAQITIGGADLRITKVRLISGSLPGDLVSYQITVVNDGPNPDSLVEITDFMPMTITYTSATPSQGTVSSPPNSPVIWTVGNLAVGASATIVIEGRINNNYGTTTNIAEVTNASLPDPDSTPGNGNSNEDDQATSIGPVVGTPPTTPNISGETGNNLPSVTLPLDEIQTPLSSGETVCRYNCLPFQFYHTNRTGNWEIFRLGDVPGAPDANPNLSQGEGEGVDDIAPSRSPQGDWVAFASNRDGNWEIYLGRTDGTEQRRVTYNTIATDTDPVWGPNQYIVYESSRDGNWNLYLLNVMTGYEHRITSDPASDINAAWSPGGDRILFQSDRSGTWQIYEYDFITGITHKISDGLGEDMDPQYAPDGSARGGILFRSYRADHADHSVLYLSNADGSNPTPISDINGNASNAAWSNMDDLIAYQSDVNVDLDIFIYEIASGQTRQLTDNDVDDYAPTWLCTLQYVIFTSDIDTNANIYQASALPIDAPPVDLLEEEDAMRLTDSDMDDIYPMDAPNNEYASREGLLPETASFAIGQTDFLPFDTAITVIDTSSLQSEAWQALNVCQLSDTERWAIFDNE